MWTCTKLQGDIPVGYVSVWMFNVHSPRSVNGCECGSEEAHCCVVLFFLECGLLLVDKRKFEC